MEQEATLETVNIPHQMLNLLVPWFGASQPPKVQSDKFLFLQSWVLLQQHRGTETQILLDEVNISVGGPMRAVCPPSVVGPQVIPREPA